MGTRRNSAESVKPYSAFEDPYLQPFLKSPTIQKHLAKLGMLSIEGRFLSDSDFKRQDVLRQNQESAQRLMAKEMMMKNRDFQLGRQLELQRQLEAVRKVELYRKVKGQSQRNGLLQMEAMDLEHSFGSSNSNAVMRRVPRTISTSNSGNRNSSSLQSSDQGKNSSGYHTDGDDESDRRISRNPKRLPSFNHVKRYLDDVSKFQELHKLDPSSLESYKEHLEKELDAIKEARDGLPYIYLDSPSSRTSYSSGIPFLRSYTQEQLNIPPTLYEYRQSRIRSVSAGRSSYRESVSGK